MNKIEFDKELLKKCVEFRNKPAEWADYFFPWKQEGPLKDHYLDDWQRTYLNDLGSAIEKNPKDLQRFAVASTHGSGKSALVAIIILWFMSTRPQANIVVTANTDNQLKTKTAREVQVWLDLVINKHWFTLTKTKLVHNSDDSWVCNFIPNNPEKPEAIAGSHAKHLLVLIDEASAIDHRIYEALYGAMSTEGAVWLTFGNGTRNTGPFFDSFHSQKHRWNTRHIDGRDCRMTNKNLINQFIEDYGIDSDIVKVRWLGLFPSSGDDVLIPSEAVDEAVSNDLTPINFADYPIFFGVDVARSGSDESVIVRRQGPKLTILGRYLENDLMKLVKYIVDLASKQRPDQIFVDETGLGAGVVDRLKELQLPVKGVNFATRAVDQRSYAQMRSELWGSMKDWILECPDIPGDRDLIKQLKQQPYGYNERMQIQLLSKKHMKAQGLSSPDIADAVATTFASAVMKPHRIQTQSRRIIIPSSRGWS